MTRVLLVTSPEKGHLNPMVGVAQALLADGHTVGWLCLPEPSPQLAALPGLHIVRAELPHLAGFATGGAELARLVRDAAALRGWIRTLLLDLVPGQIEPVKAALRSFRPDVVATDGMQYAAVIAAEQLGLPWAGVSSALTLLQPDITPWPLMDTVRGLADERDALFRGHLGHAPRFQTCEALSPRQNFIFATRALVGDLPLPPATELVGPSIPRGPRGDEPAFTLADDPRPLVYLSFGSQISFQPELFAAVAAAMPGHARLLIAAGELADDAAFRASVADAEVVAYAPQRQVLARAALMISHGGANSVMEAMIAGVPLLLHPVCNDQPVQAHVVSRAGVGRVVGDLARDLAELLAEDAPERQKARLVAADYARHDGARHAAQAIARLA